MRASCLLVLCACLAFGQDESPPELENPSAPSVLPPLEAPPLLHGRLHLTFRGASAFRERQLLDGLASQIQMVEDYGLDEAAAYDVAFYLDSFYRQHGYTQAVTTPRIKGPWELELFVQEGPLAHVGHVLIEGNAAFDSGKIEDYLLGPIRERFPRVRRNSDLPLVESDIFQGADLVRRFYVAEGYLDAIVDPPTIVLDDTAKSGSITLTVHEGLGYRFGNIRFEGPTPLATERMLSEISSQTGGGFTPGRLAAARRALQDLYVADGYFLAEVTSQASLESAQNGVVPVVFSISPGAIHHFQGMTVKGTRRLKDSFLQKRFGHLAGRRYDPSAVNKTFRELMQTGLFRNLQIDPVARGAEEIELQVRVEEANPKEFSLALGYASFYGGSVSLAYSDRNLFGNGRPIRFSLEANQRGFTGEAVYKDPWFLDTHTEFQTRLYALNARLKGYSKDEAGIRPSLTWPLRDNWKAGAFLSAKSVRVNHVDIQPQDLVGPEAYSVLSVGFSQTLDYRNNPSFPTSGFLFATAMDIAPGGLSHISFVRGTAAFSWYLPVTSNSSLALGARAGVIAPLGDSTLPIDERFFNGGATTVRSFSELTLGPKDRAGYPLGGEGFTVFNAEYTFPIYKDLHGAVFGDAGNLVSQAASFGLADMRYAVGAGLRYYLPIGAVRLDYGWNPDPRNGEAVGAFHFAIGVAF